MPSCDHVNAILALIGHYRVVEQYITFGWVWRVEGRMPGEGHDSVEEGEDENEVGTGRIR